MAIHPTAVVDPGAKIDPSAIIGPYVVIGPDVVVGPGCFIGPHSVVEYTHMGRDNRVVASAFLGGPPQDLKYAGEHTLLVMGDKNVVRECVTLNRGTAAHGETRIGDGCLFMAYSHVAHDCTIEDGVILVNSVGIAGHVEIGRYTVVGGIVGIHQYVRIGRFCMLGGGSMVSKDIPPYCTCQGDRATLRGLNLLGMRRAAMGRDAVQSVKEAYKALFLSGLRLEEAATSLRASGPTPEVAHMLDFIAATKRGITRPAVGAAAEEEVTI